MLWVFLERRSGLLDGLEGPVLHVAPELCFAGRIGPLLGPGYVTADLDGRRAELKMDITAIDFPDRHFSAIYCSHVLEHVTSDLRAMSELRRVLNPAGWAILLVPITAPSTFEDPTVTRPSDRERLFGQRDHFRRYGPDYVERLERAGFVVETVVADDFLGPAEQRLYGVASHAGDIYVCWVELQPRHKTPGRA